MLNPLKRSRDKVAIVGFSSSSRHLAPYNDPEYEVWGLNEEYNFDWMKRYDRWFQLHPRWDFMREGNMNHQNHPNWLKNHASLCLACKGSKQVKNLKNEIITCPECKDGQYVPPENRSDLIIYMQEKQADIPNSFKFPLEDITKFLLSDIGRPYYTSSCAFLLAFAVALGFKTIGLYGFDMGADTEYHYQKSNFEYWIGKAQGRGIEVIVPEESQLLRGKLYGYENMRTGYRQDLELRKLFLSTRLEGDRITMYQTEGKIATVKKILEDKLFSKEELKRLYETVSREHAHAQATVNFKKGAETEVEQMAKMYDAYFRLDINGEAPETIVREVEEFTHMDYTLTKEEPDAKK